MERRSLMESLDASGDRLQVQEAPKGFIKDKSLVFPLLRQRLEIGTLREHCKRRSLTVAVIETAIKPVLRPLMGEL